MAKPSSGLIVFTLYAEHSETLLQIAVEPAWATLRGKYFAKGDRPTAWQIIGETRRNKMKVSFSKNIGCSLPLARRVHSSLCMMVKVLSACLQFIGQSMPHESDVVPAMEVAAVVEALRQHLRGTHDYALHCPRAASNAGVVICTYRHWFKPFSKHRRYCQLPVSGARVQRFLQFRLASHKLPIVVGRFVGGQHVARANRVCTHCGGMVVADELHVIFDCPAREPLRQQHAPLFSTNTNTVRSLFAQQAESTATAA